MWLLLLKLAYVGRLHPERVKGLTDKQTNVASAVKVGVCWQAAHRANEGAD